MKTKNFLNSNSTTVHPIHFFYALCTGCNYWFCIAASLHGVKKFFPPKFSTFSNFPYFLLFFVVFKIEKENTLGKKNYKHIHGTRFKKKNNINSQSPNMYSIFSNCKTSHTHFILYEGNKWKKKKKYYESSVSYVSRLHYTKKKCPYHSLILIWFRIYFAMQFLLTC